MDQFVNSVSHILFPTTDLRTQISYITYKEEMTRDGYVNLRIRIKLITSIIALICCHPCHEAKQYQ